jgi:Tfp pilus assembly protein PilV
LIEVMIAVVVLSLGVLAAFAMQVVAVQSNAMAKQSTDAVSLADHFIERLRQDATAWRSDSPTSFTSTTYIGPGMLAPDTWVLATTNGPINSLGVSGASSPAGPLRSQAEFCVAYRLNWTVQNLVISGYVRIFWHQRRVPQAVAAACGVGDGLDIDDIDDPSKQADVLKNIGLYTVPFTLRITPETPF